MHGNVLCYKLPFCQSSTEPKENILGFPIDADVGYNSLSPNWVSTPVQSGVDLATDSNAQGYN